MATLEMAKSPRARRRPTRAEAAELDEQLRKAAVETFLEHGFHGTTMDAVARAAGITRRTLYARYPDKRALFADVIPWALGRSRADDLPTEVVGDDLEASLMAIARSVLARALDPNVVRLSLLLMTESSRFPDVAPEDFSLTWSPRMQAVIDLLRVHADAGSVVVDDIELAAEQFLAMVAAMPARLAAFGMRRSRQAQERHLQHAVKLFLTGALTRP